MFLFSLNILALTLCRVSKHEHAGGKQGFVKTEKRGKRKEESKILALHFYSTGTKGNHQIFVIPAQAGIKGPAKTAGFPLARE